MKTYRPLQRVLPLLFCTLFVASCQNEIPEISSMIEKKEFTFSLLQTRATDTQFEKGDCIGIYAVERTNEKNTGDLKLSGNAAENKKWTYQNGGFVPATEKDKIYSGGKKMDFYCYYPYQENISNPKAVMYETYADQTTHKKSTACDWMYARNTTGITDGNVTLMFKHLFSLYTLSMGGATNSAILTNIQNSGVLDLNTGTLQNYTGETDLILFKEQNDRYRVLLPPQELNPTKHIFYVKTEDNIDLSYPVKSVLKLAGGAKYDQYVNMVFSVFVSSSPGGMAYGGNDVILPGDICFLNAVPLKGYEFDGYYEDDKLLSKERDYSFIVKRDYHITALFVDAFDVRKTHYFVNDESGSFGFEFPPTVPLREKSYIKILRTGVYATQNKMMYFQIMNGVMQSGMSNDNLFYFIPPETGVPVRIRIYDDQSAMNFEEITLTVQAR